MIKHLWFWLVMSIVAVFILPAFISTSSYQMRIHGDLAMIEKAFGNKAASEIFAISDHLYSQVFEETGFRTWIIDHYYVDPREEALGRREGGEPVGITAKWSHNYSTALFANFYEFTFRLTQVAMWITYAFPFVIAAIWDGVMERKIRMLSFSYSSPSVYNGVWHFIIAVLFGLFIYFNLPFVVHPLLFPLAIAVMAFSLRTLVANLQRSA